MRQTSVAGASDNWGERRVWVDALGIIRWKRWSLSYDWERKNSYNENIKITKCQFQFDCPSQCFFLILLKTSGNEKFYQSLQVDWKRTFEKYGLKWFCITIYIYFRNSIQVTVVYTLRKLRKLNKEWKGVFHMQCSHEIK